MRRETVDRSWFKDSAEVATIESRTELALEQVTDQKAAESRARISEAKEKDRKARTRTVSLGKMYPVSYWAEMLGFTEDTIRSWCKGELKAQWIRNGWRISDAAMTAFLEQENKRHVR